VTNNYTACECITPIDDCSSHMDAFVNGVKIVERLRGAVDEEATEAPGRLRDRFEFLVKSLEGVMPPDDERDKALSLITGQAVKEIDRVRNEMMAAGTKYVAHNLTMDLKKAVDGIQARLMADALAALKECVCTPYIEVPGRLPPGGG
jgi:hypothetical protein